MEPLIVGIDPGTTLGYAVLDIDGKLIDLGSSKLLDRDKLIAHLSSLGSVIAVGCDKKRTPSFVEAVGKRLGARIISPDQDILVKDKRELIKRFKTDDDHQRDALASAILAYKNIGSLLRKIRIYISRNGLEDISSQLYCTVVREGVSIQYAHDLLRMPKDEDLQVVRTAIKKKGYTKEGYLKLYDKITEKASIILRLKRSLDESRKRLKEKEKELTRIRRFTDSSRKEERKEKSIAHRDASIDILKRKERGYIKENKALKKELLKLNKGVMDIQDFYVLKRATNLGKGFEEMQRFLKLSVGDMLIIDDPSVWSEKVLSRLKKVQVILSSQPFPKKIKDRFITLDSKKLDMQHFRYFSLVKKKDLDKLKNKTSLIEKIVDDHRNRHRI